MGGEDVQTIKALELPLEELHVLMHHSHRIKCSVALGDFISTLSLLLVKQNLNQLASTPQTSLKCNSANKIQ